MASHPSTSDILEAEVMVQVINPDIAGQNFDVQVTTNVSDAIYNIDFNVVIAENPVTNLFVGCFVSFCFVSF